MSRSIRDPERRNVFEVQKGQWNLGAAENVRDSGTARAVVTYLLPNISSISGGITWVRVNPRYSGHGCGSQTAAHRTPPFLVLLFPAARTACTDETDASTTLLRSYVRCELNLGNSGEPAVKSNEVCLETRHPPFHYMLASYESHLAIVHYRNVLR